MLQNAVAKNRCIYFQHFFEYWYISMMTSELYWGPPWCPTCSSACLQSLNFLIYFFLQRHQNHRDVSNGRKSALLLAACCRGGTAVALPCYSSFALMVIDLCISVFCTMLDWSCQSSLGRLDSPLGPGCAVGRGRPGPSMRVLFKKMLLVPGFSVGPVLWGAGSWTWCPYGSLPTWAVQWFCVTPGQECAWAFSLGSYLHSWLGGVCRRPLVPQGQGRLAPWWAVSRMLGAVPVWAQLWLHTFVCSLLLPRNCFCVSAGCGHYSSSATSSATEKVSRWSLYLLHCRIM